MADVTLKKDSTEARLFITGGADYFYSSARRASGGAKHFTWEDFKKDRDTFGKPDETDYFDVYAFTGGAAIPNGCQADYNYYIDVMSEKTLSDLPATNQPQGGADAKLEACEVRAPVTQYDNFDVKVKFWLWDWVKIIGKN